MNSKLVVKDNALIEASFNLSLIEQRLMLMGIVEARQLPDLTLNTPIKISVKSYIQQFSADKANGYTQLKTAVNTLFDRQFSYFDESSNEKFKERWIYKASYMDSKGYVILFFTPIVISMISRLYANFTQYLLDEVSDFKSKYSIRLYELVIKWLSNGKTQKYELSDLRAKLGLSDTEYKTMSLFKANVIDRAVNEINKKTDITVSYEQFKQGRTITHILFKIKQKPQSKSQTLSLTDKQIDLFSEKLAQSAQFQTVYVAPLGASVEEYAQQIKKKLKQPKNVQQWLPYLKEVGYTS